MNISSQRQATEPFLAFHTSIERAHDLTLQAIRTLSATTNADEIGVNHVTRAAQFVLAANSELNAHAMGACAPRAALEDARGANEQLFTTAAYMRNVPELGSQVFVRQLQAARSFLEHALQEAMR